MKDKKAKFSIKGVLGTKSLKKINLLIQCIWKKSITKDHTITSFLATSISILTQQIIFKTITVLQLWEI